MRAIVVAGAGRAFSAGFDLDMGMGDGKPDPAEVRRALENDFRIILRFWDSPKPTIAAVHGYCLGSALELALACDLTIAAEDCRFGEPEVKFGSGIVALLLPWLAGPKAAKYLLLTGDDRVSAAEAQAMGLVNRVVPAAALLDEAIALRSAHRRQRRAGRAPHQAGDQSQPRHRRHAPGAAGRARDRRRHRDARDRGIAGIQRNTEARRRQGRHRLASRENRMSKPTKQMPDEPRKFLEKYPDTRQLELLQPDMLGILRGKRVGRDEFAKPFTGGLNFCGATVLLDAKGLTFDRIDNGGRDGDPDVISTAVPGSLAPVPWAHVPTAQVLLAMDDSKGGPFFADPRQVLRHAMKPLQDMGLTAVCATELEFYLLEPNTEVPTPRVGLIPGTRKVQSGPQYGSMEDVEDADPFLADLFETCKAQNIPVGATLKEFSPGQFEINLHHVANAELAADHGVLLKRAVKAVARKHGMAASFMAKPFAEWAGCSMHVHISLVDAAGKNIFAGTQQGRARSRIRCATRSAGWRRRCRSRWRSSRRPRTPTAATGRASSCRSSPTGGATTAASRCASRCRASRTRASSTVPGGSDGNPYLVIAAILAGVHHGLTNKVEPGPMVAQESIIDEKVELPVRWSAALDAFDAGKILPKYLGEKFHRLYGICRREEEEHFHSEISDRDYEWYLRAV